MKGRWWRGAVLLLWLLPGIVGCDGAARRPSLPHSDVLFTDEFTAGETGRWQVEGDETAQATLVDGYLLLDVHAPNTVQFTTLGEQTFSDFVLEVDATQLAGSPESSYGVLFRMAGPQQFYRFEITSSGLYAVERHDGAGNWTRLTEDWMHMAPAGQEGLNATNRLGVVAVGERLSFYVNGERLAQFDDGSYRQGSVALDAGTFGRPGLQVAFDNLVVSRP